MVFFSRRLADHQRDWRQRERLFLSALFPTIAAAAGTGRGLWRCVAEWAPRLEKHGDSKDVAYLTARNSSADNALAVLVCLFASRRGERDLSGKFFCGNATVFGADREGYISRPARVRLWG